MAQKTLKAKTVALLTSETTAPNESVNFPVESEKGTAQKIYAQQK